MPNTPQQQLRDKIHSLKFSEDITSEKQQFDVRAFRKSADEVSKTFKLDDFYSQSKTS